ncbi:hypothetical protein [Aeromicrobium sp. Leaf291]|uniref:hypothetical protein n=1 Tax=Aeromicrobium sp. Leaf291 TaxID=1736325 RepID=UPI0006FA001E|nr:hypothetical protein [Aeromicrobium sp. Leaf291]KQP83776.1 hypothetical protein ASF35_01995 [Aeromicrobium sp. Leaf291]
MTFDFATIRDLTDVQAHRREMQQAESDLRAELAAKSEAAHPSRVALRNEVAAENLRRLHILAGPSPAERVAEFDARVIDLDSKRGERA